MQDVENSKKKGVGIKGKLIGLLLPLIVIVLSIILFLVYINTSRIVLSKSEELLQSNTESGVNDVRAWMNKVITALDTERDAIEYFSMDAQTELDYIKHTAKQSDAFPAGIYLATTNGALIHASFVPGPDYNLFEKSWYNNGLASEKFIFGDVYFDEDSKSYVVGASGVLKDNRGTVRGVAAADIYLDAISSIVEGIQLEKTGGMFLVESGTNMIIGHKDSSLVGTTLDTQENAMYSYISKQINSDVTGLQTYTSPSGDQIYLDFATIPNSNWVAVSYVPNSEVMADINVLTGIIMGIAVFSTAILFLLILILLRKTIINPVRQLDYVAKQIASGNLEQTISIHSKDEFGQLAENFNMTVARLRDYINYIDEISAILNKIADGNLVFTLTYDYTGEFSKVKDALNHISYSLNDTIGQINQSANQVSGGSNQVSSNAQALGQSTTEQAAAVERLSATINEISKQIKTNAENAQLASKKARDVDSEMTQSNKKMNDMINAMQDISDRSKEIGKIIKTIEDIAFQTNILALNAAVEAARAGASGKGFAVVADEVRNLASKSAEASKNTSVLVESSIQAVENGKKIVDETSNSLLLFADGAKEVINNVDKISAATNEQATSIAHVTQGIDQIAGVVQMNSATAEESAAASEELSGQAQVMKELVGRFNLQNRNNMNG